MQGETDATHVDIASKVSGRVDSIYVREGDMVRRGQLLATLATEYRFEKGDEVYFDDAPSRLKVRIIDVRVHVKGDGGVERDILALKL